MYDMLSPERGGLARPQVTVPPIPPAYLPLLQSLKFNMGIPISWLAAVCAATGWDENYNLLNTPFGRNTVRQFGLAGIWADVPDLKMPFVDCNAGWYAMYPARCCWNVDGRLISATGPPPGMYNPIENIKLAATLLFWSRDSVKSVCGEENGNIFLLWQLGCTYTPVVDAATGKCLAENLPDHFINETDRLVEFQHLYADQLGEPPIVPLPRIIPAPLLQVALTVDHIKIRPGDMVTFAATVQGGLAPYIYAWDFGDAQEIQSQSGIQTHVYSAEGNFTAKVIVHDESGQVAASLPVIVNVSVDNPPPGPPPGNGGSGLVWLGLLGLVGLVGIIGVAGAGKGGPGGKREEALRKRRQAQDNRTRATQFRAQANQMRATDPKGAADLESRAADLEREATKLDNDALRLEQEASRDEMERAAREYR